MGCFDPTDGDTVGSSEGEPVDCPEIELGHMYHEGLGVESDYAKALEWYLKAAKPSAQFPDGHPESHYYVGNMYHRGHGVVRDDTTAVAYFRKSAMLGVAVAQVATAYMLNFGVGCRKNQKEALWWLEQAARQGCADAQLLLGDNLEDDHPAEAYYWFVVACSNAEIDEDHRNKAHAAIEGLKRRILPKKAKAINSSAEVCFRH